RRNARWIIQSAGGTDVLPRWFFPERAAPFATELLHLVGRSAAAAYALTTAALLAGRGLQRLPLRLRGPLPLPLGEGGGEGSLRGLGAPALEQPSPALRAVLSTPRGRGNFAAQMILPIWLLAAALVTSWLYHQMPHILDAVS